jgi:hypothetical protein
VAADEYTDAHHARIAHLDADFSRPDIGIKNRADIANLAPEDPATIGVQAYFASVAQTLIGQVALVHVAHHPEVPAPSTSRAMTRSPPSSAVRLSKLVAP